MYKEVFKHRIIEARKENNLSQRQVAEKLKISKSTIASYETGRTEPDLETLGKIGRICEADCITDLIDTHVLFKQHLRCHGQSSFLDIFIRCCVQ